MKLHNKRIKIVYTKMIYIHIIKEMLPYVSNNKIKGVTIYIYKDIPFI